mmetsp:Transcript_1860/g.2564  ORF Transcript_1860/g.2564 Transcript_1860/m.2564 type:complete len:249 (-) Transcript_1860:51-797(-)|eukprot:CAMPEP_0178900150 /NCGR_PEP_ID=MMETSP0786-20121207/3313_1 /TAXON_ID=186022 /ORGANISM="Thalassionema frauenfeldii, Strain CCMP 1798" /LENGTH=248 /DNA_ID=CAMNT_0020571121 /DNA_START=293 /DNA_END=1039 /DNA_ORIENTATION=-
MEAKIDISSFFPEDNEPKRNKSKRKGRHGARNQHRHKSFVKWLVETFPLISNADGADSDRKPFVLDIAGGKGEVAARLCMCHQQNVVMVDPRPADIANCYKSLVLPKIPNKWQRRIADRLAENPNFVEETVESRFRQVVTCFDDESLASSIELQKAVNGATIILGLHADGATEAIVNAALKYNKPFCVVPCCVFPNFFTTRQIEENGKIVPVRSHEQFCKYLALKDPRLKVEKLPFEGRNIAIWWDGK